MRINELQLQETSGCSLQGSFTPDLIESKVWLINELANIEPEVGTVYILGSWYSNMAIFMHMYPKLKHGELINVEKNKKWLDQGARMLKHIGADNFEDMDEDVNDLDYRQLGDDGVVINTSLNDIEGTEWWDNIPDGTLVALQSRDNNPKPAKYESLEDIEEAFPMAVYYSGSKTLEDPQMKYNRYMVIGRK